MKVKKVLKKAKKGGWAVPQFNFSTLEQYSGIIGAALRMEAPVILGTSVSEAGFVGMEAAVSLAEAARRRGALVWLNLDHARTLEETQEAVEAGYDLVHIDASRLPLEENIKLTRRVARYAHRRGVLVEGELGQIKGGSDDSETPDLRGWDLVDADEVNRFVKRSKVDLLAPAVGSVHGVYERMPSVEFDLLRSVRAEAGRVHLVFHGASGVAPAVLDKVLAVGVQKMNINTTLRKAWRSSLESSLDRTDSVKPYNILKEVVQAVQEEAERYISLLDAGYKIN